MNIPDFSTLGTPVDNCGHCGSRRAVTTVLEMRAALQAKPSPLLAQLVYQLRRVYGGRVPIYICPGCGCVTADSRAHID